MDTSIIKIVLDKNKFSLSSSYMQSILEYVKYGALICNTLGEVVATNNAIEEILGMKKKDISSISINNLFDNWDSVLRTVSSDGVYFDNISFFNFNTSKTQFSISVYPIYNSDNILCQFICILKNIEGIRKLSNKIKNNKAIYTFDKIISNNTDFLKTISYAKKISHSKSTILITGESGTGKEVFAQSIHNYGDRKNKPFIAINCGAIPKSLIESELFGYEEGAFTGAKRGGNKGKFEMADGGTVFLDEIGELPLDMQVNFLRVIEEGVVSRIGSSKQFPVNIRIIAATNKNLKHEVEYNKFRKDLYYRLDVLPIYLPPLKSRNDDIPILIDYFMDKISKRLNKPKVHIPNDYMDYLINYQWPGNIRELENIVELIINTESVPLNFNKKQINIVNKAFIDEDDYLSLDSLESIHISKVLRKFDGNISLSANALGIGRNTLYRKIQKYNISNSV